MQIRTILDAVVTRITDVPRLDPITVITRDVGANAGQIIIECYGKAWSAYWAAMPEPGVRQFIVEADLGYIVNRLMNHDAPKKAQASEVDYLNRIVTAIQEAFKAEAK
jgi:hypothetical protein